METKMKPIEHAPLGKQRRFDSVALLRMRRARALRKRNEAAKALAEADEELALARENVEKEQTRLAAPEQPGEYKPRWLFTHARIYKTTPADFDDLLSILSGDFS